VSGRLAERGGEFLLAYHLETALGHLRRLTIDNAQLRHGLEAARAITRLDPGRKRSQRA